MSRDQLAIILDVGVENDPPEVDTPLKAFETLPHTLRMDTVGYRDPNVHQHLLNAEVISRWFAHLERWKYAFKASRSSLVGS